MARPRLTDAEREEKRKARSRFSFSDAAYKHYDPRVEGYGSEDEWISAAEALAAGCTTVKATKNTNPDLVVLGLDAIPQQIADLVRAFRKQLHIVHPDHKGGSHQATLALLDAYKRLTKFYK